MQCPFIIITKIPRFESIIRKLREQAKRKPLNQDNLDKARELLVSLKPKKNAPPIEPKPQVIDTRALEERLNFRKTLLKSEASSATTSETQPARSCPTPRATEDLEVGEEKTTRVKYSPLEVLIGTTPLEASPDFFSHLVTGEITMQSIPTSHLRMRMGMGVARAVGR